MCGTTRKLQQKIEILMGTSERLTSMMKQRP